MSSVSSTSSLLSNGAVLGSLLKASSENIAVGAALLKQASNADKQMVQELLPPPSSGRLDIRA
jgi:hypothetical protein